LATQSVAQVQRLTRRGIYDGLLFHRVIEGFVAQTGNPNNHDGGKSDEPNLPPEFTFRLGSDTAHVIVARQGGDNLGFVGATPYESVDEGRMAASPDHRITAWGVYCPGVMGMGRDEAPGSGNSEIFFMREAARRLERGYTVVGRVVQGLDVIRSLPVGEPPAGPERMIRVRLMADLPPQDRPTLQVLNTTGPEFRALADRVRAQRGADFSVCDIDIPVKGR
jgi:peptidylprolyl isomerase